MKARLLEVIAMLLIGDLLGALQPRRHAALWRDGPRPWRTMVDTLDRRPGVVRAVGAGMIGAGLWLAARQTGSRP